MKYSIQLKIILYISALIWLIFSLYPLIFLIQNSTKTQWGFLTTSPWSLPPKLCLTNYTDAIKGGLLKGLLNSVIVTLISLVIVLFIGSMASFAIARFKTKIGKWFLILFISGMTVPIYITLIPVYIITRYIGLYDTLWGLIGPYVASSLPVTVFILFSAMETIPKGFEEAAVIDGASAFQIYWRIILPISRPTLIAVGIYDMVHYWNEFIYALVLLSSPKSRTLPLALWNAHGMFSMNVPEMLAGIVISLLPLIILYGITQEKMIQGMMAGALKG